MATLYVRNIPDDLYEKLQDLAKRENRSVNAQVITLLQDILPLETEIKKGEKNKTVKDILIESRNRRRLNPSDFGLPDSTELIREDRNR
ncbi:MAG: hypothetical protein HC903_07950 [Methylacidiphilales bacterium]|nr:hypothetical protein [Candidatus Methylacidiphilales bacterium]NJR17227.1 hypothetical protein [Calothrix sp. CSU_2_0]